MNYAVRPRPIYDSLINYEMIAAKRMPTKLCRRVTPNERRQK